MGVFLLIIGLLAMPIAVILLIINFVKKKPKKIPIITLIAGFFILVFGLWTIGTNMTPEELAALEEKQEIREQKLLERKQLEVEKAAELKKKEEEELQTEKEESEKKAKELAAKEENERLEAEENEIKVTKEKNEVQKSPEKSIDKTTVEKSETEIAKEDSISLEPKNIIYDVFKSSNDEIDETITVFEFDENEKVLTATVKGKDGWSDKSIGLGFYEDSTAVYRELAKDGRIAEVWLTITFPMKDTYGNVEDEEVMSTWMSRETMDKTNWKSFDYQNLIDVVDGKRIYPQFVQ